jgi:putative membrane protein
VSTSLTVLATTAMHPGWNGPGFHLLWLALIPVFWVAVIALIVALVGRRWRRRAWAGSSPDGRQGPPWAWRQDGTRSAEQVLAERFAQGEVDEAEYRERLGVLRANREAPPTR